MCCESIIAKIWTLTLFSGIYLLFMCMILSNSAPNTLYHNVMVNCGISGAVIFVVCISAACWIKPLKRLIWGEPINLSQNRQILYPNLYTEPREFLVISNQMDIALATYIKNNIPEPVSTDDIVIAEPINQV